MKAKLTIDASTYATIQAAFTTIQQELDALRLVVEELCQPRVAIRPDVEKLTTLDRKEKDE